MAKGFRKFLAEHLEEFPFYFQASPQFWVEQRLTSSKSQTLNLSLGKAHAVHVVTLLLLTRKSASVDAMAGSMTERILTGEREADRRVP